MSYRFVISPASKNATTSSKAAWSSALGTEHMRAVAQEVQGSMHNCVGPKTRTTANFATEHGQRSRCTWQHYHEASGMSDVGSSRCVFSFWKVWKPRAVCVARDPRNYKPHVSLRAFRRTRVIWFVARPQKRRTISGGEACVYLDQALFCEWDVTCLCMRDGGMIQVCLKPGIVYR